jgi:hypothetical protein
VLAAVEHPAEGVSLTYRESGKVHNILRGEIYTKGNRARTGTLDLVLVSISTFVGQKNMNKKVQSSLEQSALNDVNDSEQNNNYTEDRTE